MTSKLDQKQTGRWNRKRLSTWSPFKNLSAENQNSIVKRCRQCSWPQSGAVTLQNLLSNLPDHVEKEIKRIILSNMLKKVKFMTS